MKNGKVLNEQQQEEALALADESRELHKQISIENEKINDALSKVVLGALAFITSWIFFVLSIRRVRNKLTGVDPNSLQFWTFVILLVIGVVLLTIGLVKVFISESRKSEMRKRINEIANDKDVLLSK